MKANTDRSGRFNFDSIAEAYDDSRFGIPGDLVADVTAAVGFRAGQRALEVGAGTGQLTSGLVAHGWNVTAVEPGPRMRDLLAAKFGGRVALVGEPFEELEPDGSFDTVWSANAFHWVDPAVSYANAADALRPGGHLVLVWTFTAAEDAVQTRLNEEVFAADWPGLVRVVDNAASIGTLMEHGAAELFASGRFTEPEIRRRTYRHQLCAEEYAKLLLTFADMTQSTSADRASLVDGIRSVASEFTVLDITYASVASKLPDPEVDVACR